MSDIAAYAATSGIGPKPGVVHSFSTSGVLPKLRLARDLITRYGGSVWLQVDGGVDAETIERCAEAGADVFVAGSAVYGADDPAAAVQALRLHAQRATAHALWAR